MRTGLAAALLALQSAGAALPAPAAEYRSPRRLFSADVPAGWQVFEGDAPWGYSSRFLGPAEADGAWRAAIHVHLVEKGRPGFLRIDEAVKRERKGDKLTKREATSSRRWRVGGVAARRFEVTEQRQLPANRLPSRQVVLHHYYAFVPAGDGYFIIKFSTTRETYLNYREAFEKLLATFTILGY